MAFNYQSAGPAGQTVLTPTSKDVQCKSFKLDFSAANATTAVAFDIGWLPKEAQVVNTYMAVTTPVSGTSVTAATINVTVGSGNVFQAQSVFTAGNLSGPAANYYNVGLNPTADQKITGTLTLTGGTVANAGIIWLNILYVI